MTRAPGGSTEHQALRPQAVRGAILDSLGIVLLWGLGLLIVDPRGDFPLIDDWSFGLTVRHFVETGSFHPTGWVSMPLLTNVLWGSLFCIPAGVGFEALRISTLVLSLVGIVGTYVLVRELGLPRWAGWLAALTAAFNPLYFSLSNTFMTDVPFTALGILAVIFLVRTLKGGGTVDLLLGTLFTVAAVLSRQLALCIPLAFSLFLLLRRGFGRRNLRVAAVPSVLGLGALLVFEGWLEAADRVPAKYHAQAGVLLRMLSDPPDLVLHLVNNLYKALLYLGLFLLPVLGIAFLAVWRRSRGRAGLLLGISLVGLVVGGLGRARFLGAPAVMPLLPSNNLAEFGVGPLFLRDTFVLDLGHVPPLPEAFWLAVTGLSLLGAAMLIPILFLGGADAWRRRREGAPIGNPDAGVYLLLCSGVYLAPLLVAGFFDRYLVPVIPLLAAGLLPLVGASAGTPRSGRRLVLAGAMVLVGLSAVYSVVGTRDWFTRNRVRWEALDRLVHEDGIDPRNIDGGFEFNGIFLYDAAYEETPEKSWWWVQDATYQLAFGAMPGYRVIRETRYSCWLPPHEETLYVLERTGDGRSP